MAQPTDFTTLDDRPYNGFLERSVNNNEPATNSNTSSASPEATSGSNPSSTSSNGAKESMPVKSDGAMGDVWIKNFIRSENWSPKKVGFYIDGQTGYAEFSNVHVSGNIEALTGHFGGFIIGADYVRDAANLFGMASTATEGNDVRFWAGASFSNRADAPFRVYEDGSIAGTGLTVTKIDLPDTTSVNSFHVDVDGNTWWGANITTGYAGAPASVLKSGVANFISGYIGGCTLAPTSIGSNAFVSGPLGSGWNISNTGVAEFQNVTVRGIIRTSVFEKDTISAVNGIVLVSSADALGLDMTALDLSTLTITGQTTFFNNEVIRLKDGTDDEWMLVTDAGSAPTYIVTRDLAGSYGVDANPIWKKGTAVVSMGRGNGLTYADTLSINVSDNIFIPNVPKAGIPTNTSLLTLTIVVRDYITSTENINNNAPTALSGFILLDSSSTYSPYIDVYGRNSNTYSDYSIHARLGWLKGITDLSVGLNNTDVWGLYSDNVYLKGKIIATSGKIGSPSSYWNIGANGITAVSNSTDVMINYGKTDFGQDSTSGFILGYDYSAAKPKFEIGSSSSKLFTYDGVDFSITGGTITGGLIQTATSGRRIDFSATNNSMNFHDSSGVQRAIIATLDGAIMAGNFIMTGDGTANENRSSISILHNVGGQPEWSQLAFEVSYSSQLSGMYIEHEYNTTNAYATVFFNGLRWSDNFVFTSDQTVDIGASGGKADDIWCNVLHYNTLSLISDIAVKENIVDMPRGLTELLQLETKQYDRLKTGTQEYGLIAQDVQLIMPEIVTEYDLKDTEDGPVYGTQLAIDSSALMTVMIKSIQELEARVKVLEGV